MTFYFRAFEIMLRKHYFGILVIISSAGLHKALKTCKEQARSTYGHYLAGHVISTRISSSLSECVIMCLHDFRCKSMNFRVNDKSCDLNDADRHTHPEDYGPKEGSVYMDTTEKHGKVSLQFINFDYFKNNRTTFCFYDETSLHVRIYEKKW